MQIFKSIKALAAGLFFAAVAPAANAAVLGTVGPMSIYAELDYAGSYDYFAANPDLILDGHAVLNWADPEIDAIRPYFLTGAYEVVVANVLVADGFFVYDAGTFNANSLIGMIAGLPASFFGPVLPDLTVAYNNLVTGPGSAEADILAIMGPAAANPFLSLLGIGNPGQDSAGNFTLNVRLLSKTVAAVPIPATALLLGLGIAGLGAVRRRKSFAA